MPVILQNRPFEISKNYNDLESFIQYIIDENLIEKSIIVLPTKKLVRNIQKVVISKYYEKYERPITPPKIFNLEDFSIYFYKLFTANTPFTKISDAYRLVLMEEASKNVTLNFFKSKNRELNYAVLSRINDVIYGLKEDGILPKDLIKDIESFDENSNKNNLRKMTDIYKIYNEYQLLITDKLLDNPEILMRLDYYLSKTNFMTIDDKIKSGLQVDDISEIEVALFGFTEFKLPEIKFLRHFSKSNIKLVINLDFSEQNGPLFGNLQESRDKLLSSGYTKVIVDEFDSKVDLFKILKSQYIRRFLFEPDDLPIEVKMIDDLEILECENIDVEIKSIAKYVKYLILKQDYQPDEICICVRNPEQYSNKFRETFYNYRIPVNITDRFKLSSSPVIISIFNVIDVVINSFYIDDLIRLFKNPYIDLKYQNGNEEKEFDGSNLINLAQSMRIVGGKGFGGTKYWKLRFENAIHSQLVFKKYLLDDPNVDNLEIQRTDNKIKNIEKALENILALSEKITFSNEDLLPSEFNKIIRNQIVTQFKIRDKILSTIDMNSISNINISDENRITNIKNLKKVEKDNRALKQFYRILDELIFILNDRYPDKKYKLEELYQKLKTAVLGSRYQVKESTNQGVTVTSIEQTRGIPYPVMILCGANDGDFPLSYQTEKFLGKVLKESETRHIRSEQIQFYQFITNAKNLLDADKKKIIISYRAKDDDVDLIRSTFVDSLQTITDVKIKNIQKITENHLQHNIENIEGMPVWLKYLNSYDEVFVDIALRTISKNQSGDYKDKFNELDLIMVSDSMKYLLENLTDKNTNLFDAEKLNVESHGYIQSFLKKSFSISNFESFMNCPYKYYIERILRFESKQDLTINFSPLEQGNIIHYLLYLFYLNLQVKEEYSALHHSIYPNLPVLKAVKLNPNMRNEYWRILRTLAKDYLEKVKVEHSFYQIDEISILGNNLYKGILETWLDNELNLKICQKTKTEPALFEFSFGSFNNNSNQKSVESIKLSEEIKIKGKIDRIEFYEIEGKFYFLIGDYKARQKVGNNTISKGESFQMPIYIYATKEILKTYYNIEAEPLGGVYYGYKEKSEKDFSKFVLVNKIVDKVVKLHSSSYFKGDLNNILADTILLVEKIFEKIKKYKFDVAPLNNNSCKYCNFSEMCRIKQRNHNLYEII